MKDNAHLVAKDWLMWALAGIGVSFPPHHYLGGLFLAAAGAAVATKMQPDQDKRELWLVMLTAWVVATVAAVLLSVYKPGFPPQIAMAATGFFSRFIARFFLALGGVLEARTDTIFDRVLDRVLPKRGDGQ